MNCWGVYIGKGLPRGVHVTCGAFLVWALGGLGWPELPKFFFGRCEIVVLCDCWIGFLFWSILFVIFFGPDFSIMG